MHCPVCYEPYLQSSLTIVIPCKHDICWNCLQNWAFQGNCPTCRGNLHRIVCDIVNENWFFIQQIDRLRNLDRGEMNRRRVYAYRLRLKAIKCISGKSRQLLTNLSDRDARWNSVIGLSDDQRIKDYLNREFTVLLKRFDDFGVIVDMIVNFIRDFRKVPNMQDFQGGLVERTLDSVFRIGSDSADLSFNLDLLSFDGDEFKKNGNLHFPADWSLIVAQDQDQNIAEIREHFNSDLVEFILSGLSVSQFDRSAQYLNCQCMICIAA